MPDDPAGLASARSFQAPAVALSALPAPALRAPSVALPGIVAPCELKEPSGEQPCSDHDPMGRCPHCLDLLCVRPVSMMMSEELGIKSCSHLLHTNCCDVLRRR